MNGPSTQEIYKVLKEKAGVKDIDWNFSKFLVKGDDVKWFSARTEPVSFCLFRVSSMIAPPMKEQPLPLAMYGD